jgi:geranylgeranyl reductase family protein
MAGSKSTDQSNSKTIGLGIGSSNRSVFDLIVVGAGPGGSNAAAAALRHGLSVAQVDRYRFPRVKPCGGGVTMKSSKALGLDPLPAMRGEFSEVEVNIWRRKRNRFGSPPSVLLRMVVRSQFDSCLVSQNLRMPGFQFFDDERVLDISYDGRFRVRTARRTLLGRQLVGADGVYSVVNRFFPIGHPKGHAVAIEVTLRRDEATLPVETPPCFDIGAIEPGYGWVFPKDDHWNVGLYALAKSKNLRQQLTSYIAAKGFGVKIDPLATSVAQRFPYGGYRVSLPAVPVYLVGDAGGFGDAFTGEGIYHALESGRIAGETAHDCLAGRVGHQAYYQRLRRSVLADTFITYNFARRFYRDLDRAAALVGNRAIWQPLLRGYTAGVPLAESLKQGGWFWFVSAVARLPHLFLAARG